MSIYLEGNPANLPELAFTHGGRFHADDIFSAALLQLLRPDIRIHRGFVVPKNFSGIVFDIGDGPFDHHKRGSPRRANGAPYAAFGLLWREYGHYLLPPAWAADFDQKFIQPMDIDDNKGTGHVLGVLFGTFNPLWDGDEDPDTQFFKAVDIARELLGRRLESMRASYRGLDRVREALGRMQDNLVELPSYIPWKPVLVDSAAEFVVFPTPRGGYSVQCVPLVFSGKTGHKVPFPPAWYGRPAEELRRLSGVEDITFCHASGFMCSVGSPEGARALVRKAQAEYAARKAQKAAGGEANADAAMPLPSAAAGEAGA